MEDSDSLAGEKCVAILRMCTSIISCFASSAIIVMVSRSNRKLQTTQNRLLAGLSISDIINSLAMSFASIPMPRGTANEWMTLGNTITCEVQASFICVGSFLTPAYNASLCIYYLFKIRFNWNDDRIEARVEPMLHIIPIIFTVSTVIYCLIKDFFNPMSSICFISDYPKDCSNDPDVQCERGQEFSQDGFILLVTAVAALMPTIIFSCMLSVVIKVRNQERRMHEYGIGSLSLQSNQATQRNAYVRKTLNRAISYSLAWLIPHIFPAVQAQMNLLGHGSTHELEVLIALFYPLQGLLNFMVFLYPKLVLAKRMYPEYSMSAIFITAVKTRDLTGVNILRRPKEHNSMVVRDIENINGPVTE